MVCSTIINDILPSAGNMNNYNCIHENKILDFFCFYIALTVYRENIVGTFYVFYSKIKKYNLYKIEKNIVSIDQKPFHFLYKIKHVPLSVLRNINKP